MKYEHRFRVRAPLADVADFHNRSTSMAAITPPLFRVQLDQAPEHLESDDEMAFTMRIGPFPVRWRAQIADVSATGFSDRQLEGPFRHWIHRHTFEPVDENTTEVVDRIQAGLKRHPWWGLVGLAMWLGLPFLFAYRGWKTRRLLESRGQG